MKKLFLFVAVIMLFVACNSAAMSNGYEGTWTVVEDSTQISALTDATNGDIYYSRYFKEVIISKDSMIAFARLDNARYNYHYRIVKNNVIELERTFLQDPGRPDYVNDVAIYFDADNHLIIENFSLGDISQIFPPLYLPIMLQRK